MDGLPSRVAEFKTSLMRWSRRRATFWMTQNDHGKRHTYVKQHVVDQLVADIMYCAKTRLRALWTAKRRLVWSCCRPNCAAKSEKIVGGWGKAEKISTTGLVEDFPPSGAKQTAREACTGRVHCSLQVFCRCYSRNHYSAQYKHSRLL